MSTWDMAGSAAGALLFAGAFLIGGGLHLLRSLVGDPRSIVSFGAGMSIAYVFVHVMPELHGARRAFAESASIALRYEGMVIYFLSLVGFLAFYGLEHLRKRLARSAEAEAAEEMQAFRLHIAGFAAYAWLIGYLLVHNLEPSKSSTVLYVAAIAVHLLGVGDALRKEYGAAYERSGRFVLAGMSLLGWGTGVLAPFPHIALAMLVAFVSGAIIVNTAIMELPSERDGRFKPFLAGGIVYGLILLPLG